MRKMIVVALISLAGCTEEVSEAKRLVAAEVPGATFRNVRAAADNGDVRRPKAVCGEVASYEAPNDYARFVVLLDRKEVTLDLPEQITGPHGDVPDYISGMMDSVNSRAFEAVYSIRCAP